ncbi:MAG: hypothetical protein ACEQSU_13080 [Microgenomates group bacterium]
MFSKILLFALLAILPLPSASLAATVTYDLTATVVQGPGFGQSTLGSISFDDSFLVIGNEVLAPLSRGGVTVTFGLATGGKTVWFTQNQDSNYPVFPQLSFVNFNLSSVNFQLLHNYNGVSLTKYGVLEVLFGNTLSGDAMSGYYVDAYVREVSTAPVPLPTGLPLFAASLTGLAFAAWRRSQFKAVELPKLT